MYLFHHVACLEVGDATGCIHVRADVRQRISQFPVCSSGPKDSDTIPVDPLNVACEAHTSGMLRPSDLSLTGTFHASTLLTLYGTDSFSMFGVVGAGFTTNLHTSIVPRITVL